jgi:hypothetical protein
LDKTIHAVRQQIAAMGAGVFEIGLFKPGTPAHGQASMIPRVWDADTLIRSVPWLRYQNADGRNIYVRPKGEHDLSLVDDLTTEAIQRMKATGFTPAAVVETSPGNFQAWLKHPATLSREVSTAAARKLAEQFGGDKGAADWRHFGRLAGFTNRKAKYASDAGLYPFVRLMEAHTGRYPEGESFVASVRSELEVRARENENRKPSLRSSTRQALLKTIDDFRANPRYGGDNTRIDLAFAIYALSHGATSEDVAAAIRSRDLSHKGNDRRQGEYVERTIVKASKVVGLSSARWLTR